MVCGMKLTKDEFERSTAVRLPKLFQQEIRAKETRKIYTLPRGGCSARY